MNYREARQKRLAASFLLALSVCLAANYCCAQERRGDPRDPPPRGREQRRDDRDRRGGPKQYSLEQALSDQAQLHTIAFSGLAFITGDFGACTFLPPGKVCDFFGFQYMRDIDAAGAGHNPKFLGRAAGSILHVLSSGQRALLEKAAYREAAQLRELAEKRWPLIKAFCRQLMDEVPAGSSGLNKESVSAWAADIFQRDAQISYSRAQVFGRLAASLTPEQKASLGRMKFGDFNTWPDVDAEPYKLPRGTEKLVNVAYMTCASEFFSWYAGSADAGTYFCPERHGTYFGGFYMKDMPAMGKRDYNISTSLTGDSGRDFLNILTADQRSNITDILGLQRKSLQEIARVRRAIVQELREFLTGGQADRSKVVSLGRRYGELDGELSYYYAEAFARVNRGLSQQQHGELEELRGLEGYISAPAYIYSEPVREEILLPDTDHFFFPPAQAAGGR